MGHSKDKRIPTSESKDLTQNLFPNLNIPNLPNIQPSSCEDCSTLSHSPSSAFSATIAPFKGRMDVRRETQGRGGKTVTTIAPRISLKESDLKILTHFLKNKLNCGGTFKETHIQLQGDCRAQVKSLLEELGFKVVFCGS